MIRYAIRHALLALLLCAPAAAAVAPSRYSATILIDDRGRPEERRALETALARLRASPTARRLETRRLRLEPTTLSFGAITESTSAPLETDVLGRSLYDEAPPRVLLNERLLVSTRTLTETLAHELYGHDLIVRESRRAGADVSWLLENEGFSVAVGSLVALEAGDDVIDDDRVDWIAESTEAYCAESLFKDSPDGIQLSLAEARDPRGAIAARLVELARRRRSVKIRRQEMAVWNFRLARLEEARLLDPHAVSELQDALDLWTSTGLPQRQALLDAAEPHLKRVQAWLDEPEGRAWAASLVAVSSRPYAAALEEEWAGLGRAIAAARLRTAPPPDAAPAPPPAAKQLSWDDVTALFRKDKKESPGRWKDAPEAGDPVEWIVK